MTDDPGLEELTLLLDELANEFAATTDACRRKEIATLISELTPRISSLKTRTTQKS